MLGDARLASQFADEMLKRNIYVIGFSFPVVMTATPVLFSDSRLVSQTLGAERSRAHSRASVRRAFQGRSETVRRRLRPSRPTAQRDSIDSLTFREVSD